MRSILIAAALMGCSFIAPAHAQDSVETLIACATQEQHQFPANRVGVIWTLRDANDNSEHQITFTAGGPLLDPAGYAAPTVAAVNGWTPTFDALRDAAIQRRRVSVTHVGEEIYNITVLWSEGC